MRREPRVKRLKLVAHDELVETTSFAELIQVVVADLFAAQVAQLALVQISLLLLTVALVVQTHESWYVKVKQLIGELDEKGRRGGCCCCILLLFQVALRQKRR